MYRLIYISTAIKMFDEESINKLLEKARENNKRNNITGLLIIKGKNFIQAIEGEKYAVKSLFNKIKGDKRHTNISIIEEGVTQKKLFHDWDMGFKCFEDITLTETKRLKEFNFDNADELPKIFEKIIEIF